jgi:hypothetical protein
VVWKETIMYEETKGSFFLCTFNSRLLERDFLICHDDPREIFVFLYQHLPNFPQHFIFANFQCLRCGECCDDQRSVYKGDIQRWTSELRYDIIENVECYDKGDWCINIIDFEPCDDCSGGETINASDSMRCPFVRKVRNKLYYKCRIRDSRTEECSGYLCNKSLPIANLKLNGVEEIIQKKGIRELRKLWRRQRC